MTASPALAPVSDPRPAGPRASGGVDFVDQAAWPALVRSPAATPWLEVGVASPPWRQGKLREVVESAIEQALEARGAPASGVHGLGDLDATLSDQLYRARCAGADGLVLYVPSLAAATSPSGALDAEDSAVLRWWIEATTERPVRLVLDAGNRAIGAYGPPTRLELLVGPRVQGAGAPEDTPEPIRISACEDGEIRGEPDGDEIEGHVAGQRRPPAAVVAPPSPAAPAPPTATSASRRDEPTSPRFGRLMVPRQGAMSGETSAAGAERHSHVVPVFPRREPTTSPTAAAAPVPATDWRAFASDLELARGPKPLAIVERLFMSRYVPLLESVARGETDQVARRTVEQWGDDFARSYTEGFSALKVTGKRPRMVLDAPQLCNQIARLHGAKSTQLILVDGMRFDVGLRVQERLMQGLVAQATCTERLLLWAALPTTTPAQLDLLARGPEGLTSPGPPGDGEELGVRGRTSATLRRVKVGPRDLLKLDAVESRLRESGPPLGERLDAMAEEVAAAIAAHARTQPARTLMFIFGDHGFRMESDDVGTSAATTGGASPEEVLVPAFAWLVGDVH